MGPETISDLLVGHKPVEHWDLRPVRTKHSSALLRQMKELPVDVKSVPTLDTFKVKLMTLVLSC